MLLAVDRVDHVEVVVSLLLNDFEMPTEAKELDLMAVSYTHLTLPTIYSV